MLPIGLEDFIQVLASHKKPMLKVCSLVGIDVYIPAQSGDTVSNHLLFNYPLMQLDAMFRMPLSENRLVIQHNPNGDMCPIFAERYEDLTAFIRYIALA